MPRNLFKIICVLLAMTLCVFCLCPSRHYAAHAENTWDGNDDAAGGEVDVGAGKPMDVKLTVDNPLTSKTFDTVYGRVIDFAFSVAVIVTPIVILIGAAIFVTAAGDPGKITLGKRIVFWGLGALAIVLLAKGVIVLVRLLLDQKLESAIFKFIG